MKLLVKIGGTLLDSEASRRRLAGEVTGVLRSGHRIVVVHGGGKQMTRFLDERGIESRFIDGLRVTTPEVLDGVLKVVAGSINHELVAAFVQAGARAVGLSGIDASLTEAEPMLHELGLVGRLVGFNPELLELLTGHGYLPVVACLAGDRQGRIYNVNADQMAASCAVAFGAEQVLFLTDVEGVLGAGGQLLPLLTVRECENLIRQRVATGGMLTKLNAAAEALREGVRQVAILSGSASQSIERLLAGQSLGSRIVKEQPHD